MESIHAAAEERKQVISCAFSCCEGGDVSSSWPMVSSVLIANWENALEMNLLSFYDTNTLMPDPNRLIQTA